MQLAARLAGGAVSLYSALIFFRIMLTWWSGAYFGRPYEILCSITDPYLNWFRRFRFLRLGAIDLSPVAALAILSIANNILLSFSNYGGVTVGFVLVLILQALWSFISFALGFLAVVIALRLIAYLIRANIYAPFWKIISLISEPVLYRINKMLFRKNRFPFLQSMIIALVILIAAITLFGAGVNALTVFLLKTPRMFL